MLYYETIARNTPSNVKMIASSVNWHPSAVQTGLFRLLTEGRVDRVQIDTDDKRMASWVYWRLNRPYHGEILEDGITVMELLEAIPIGKTNAVPAVVLANKLNSPPSTVRDMCKKLTKMGKLQSVEGKNHRNQNTMYYYRQG